MHNLFQSNHAKRNRFLSGFIISTLLIGASACSKEDEQSEAQTMNMSEEQHDMSTMSADGDMSNMSHGGDMTKEQIDFVKSIVPSLSDRTDQEIMEIMSMMPPNYEWYVSDENLRGDVGVLVMTHGFGEEGDKIFADSLKTVAKEHPLAIGFGMAMMTSKHLQESADSLVAAGAKTIVVVPATQSEFDTGLRQYKYLSGKREEPAYMALPKIETPADILFTPPLSDNPIISQILLDYANDISTDQKNEAVIIVGHGPTGEEDNINELAMVQKHADYIRNNSEFADVRVMNLQDDAEKATRAANVQTLRDNAEEMAQGGRRILIVGFLLGTAGIQPKIEADLEGIDYKFNANGMSAHPKFATWIQESVREATNSN